MEYSFIRKRSYWLYSPIEAVRQLFYEATVLRQDSVKIQISKTEYRKFMRYSKVSENLKRILHYFYSHKIQKLPKMNSSKGSDFRIFGDVGSFDLKSKRISDLSMGERIEIALDKLRMEGNKPKPETARFIVLTTKYGIFWISLKKTGYDRLIMHSFREHHLNRIKQEVESLIKAQILKREKQISQWV